MISRRNFFGSMIGVTTGFFGLKQEKTQSQEINFSCYTYTYQMSQLLSKAKFTVFDRNKYNKNTWDLCNLLENPNSEDTFGDLMYHWNTQMDLTGIGLTWMVPNRFNIPTKLYPIPTAVAVPHPAVADYPNGYYRMQHLIPYKPFKTHPLNEHFPVAIFPAERMMRMKCPHPSPLLKYNGYSPQTAMKLYLDEIKQTEQSKLHKTNYEQPNQTSYIQPKLKRISEVLTTQLAPFFGENLRVEVTLDKVT